jgi:CHAT domain-containing protein
MTPEQVTQTIQDTIALLWPNNLLTPDQQTFVEEILRKVLFSKDLDDSLDFFHWQSQVTALEQDLTQRLASLPSPPETGATGANPATLRFALLLLYWVAAEVAEMKFDNLPARGELYQRGLTQAAAWALDAEGDPRVREQVLNLHVNLGVRLGQDGPEKNVSAEIEQYRRGLTQAAAWALDAEGDPRVREQVLKLHFNLGLSLGQDGPEKNVSAAIEQYRRGLTQAAAWALDAEGDPRVREQVLKLHVNLGVSLGQDGPEKNVSAAIEQYRRGLTQAAAWALDAEGDPRVREQVLNLHVNLGVSLGQDGPEKNVSAAIEQFRRGLDLALPRCNNPYCTPESLTAPPWLVKDTGENDPGVRFQLLRLYQVSTNAWYNLHHSHQVLALLPMVGLWTWAQAGKVSKDRIAEWSSVLDHWQLYLTTSPFFPNVTQAFQSLFHTLLDWHKDGMPNSLRLFKFVTTEKLLALSESLYALAQVEENQRTHIVYQELQNLANSSFVEDARAFPLQQQARYQQLTLLWQQLSLSPSSLAAPLECNKNYCTKEPLECNKNYCTKETTLECNKDYCTKEPLECNKNYCTKETTLECNKDYCTELQRLPWWKKLWHHHTITQLRDQVAAYQQQQRQHEAAPHHPDWQTAVAKVDTAILDWLVHNLHQQNPTLPGDGLEELSSILLGILLASSPTPVADTLKQWQETPPWQTSEQMQTALALTRWERFIRLQEPQLYMWINWLRDAQPKSATLQRLNITLEKENFAQPELQKWLREFSQGRLDSLQQNLNSAWKRAQKQARNLTDRLTWVDSTEVLAMVILGDVRRQMRLSLQKYLKVDFDTAPVLDTLANVKQRFNRAVSIYKPVHLPLEQTVYEWAKVRLQEILKEEDHTGGREQEIWETLETARIGLTSLAFQPPANWEETLGRQLWGALRDSVNWIRQGNWPAEDAPWLPLEVWLETFDKWLCNNPYCTPDGAHEALVQPFFDPTQQRLRILWLDNEGGLTLRELPDDCAPQSLWENNSPVGVINQWTRGVNTLQQPQPRGGVPGPLSPFPECAQMMQSVPVQTLAKTLADWANTADLKQLTIIWPAPLGQLPWETLLNLEALLAREISIGHWLAVKKRQDDQEERTVWLVSDPSGQIQCMQKEQQWLARQFDARRPAVTVTAEAPCPSMFDALHRLRTHRHTYFIAHGQYDRANPLASRLSLHDGDQRYLPLWLCSVLPLSTELLILSACESNLYGQETQGLLAPIGIGPSLAAAGVQTVVGTLWPCDGLAALCFVYYLYKFAQETPKAGEPKLPWHHLVARARKAVRDLTREELKRLAETEWLLADDDACRKTAGYYLTVVARPGSRPFQDLSYWGGFTVMGKMVQ